MKKDNARKFIHSSKLLNSHKKGQLDIVFEKFDRVITDENFLGAGDDVSTFIYNDLEVMKICTKQCRYFLTFKCTSGYQGVQFQQNINLFSPYFLPVNSILYEDKNVLIYTQNRCEKIKKKKINITDVLDIFKMVRLMFKKKCVLSDFGPHNMGVHNGHACLFDYHSLQPIYKVSELCDHKIETLPPVNLNRIGRNLTLYMTFIHAFDKAIEYKKIMKNLKEKSVKIIKKDNLLPDCYMKLFKHLMTHKETKSDKIISLLDVCIKYLSNKSIL